MSFQKGRFIVLPTVITWDGNESKRYISTDNNSCYKEINIPNYKLYLQSVAFQKDTYFTCSETSRDYITLYLHTYENATDVYAIKMIKNGQYVWTFGNRMMIRNSITDKCYFVEVSQMKKFVLTEVEQIDHSHIKGFCQIDYTDTVFIYGGRKILIMNIDRKLIKDNGL